MAGGLPVVSATENAENATVLSPVEVSMRDTRALQNGARLFVNYCLACHGAKYMRYNRMAADLNIPEALVREHMLIGARKIGDPMTTTMTRADGEQWFGVAPPDLTLIGKLRGPTWLYHYLLGFYRDDTTETGWNNHVFPNVAMPHVLYGHQQNLPPEEFANEMRDLTAFLYYMAEPSRQTRITWGIWTMLFLFVFGTLAYFLKKEYWRDID